jgi:hypothetical protein
MDGLYWLARGREGHERGNECGYKGQARMMHGARSKDVMADGIFEADQAGILPHTTTRLKVCCLAGGSVTIFRRWSFFGPEDCSHSS